MLLSDQFGSFDPRSWPHVPRESNTISLFILVDKFSPSRHLFSYTDDHFHEVRTTMQCLCLAVTRMVRFIQNRDVIANTLTCHMTDVGGSGVTGNTVAGKFRRDDAIS